MWMFLISSTALKDGSTSYSFVPWLVVCSCAFKRKEVLNSELTKLHRTGFKSIEVVLCACGDLNSFQNRHCFEMNYHYCHYLTFLYRTIGFLHTGNEDMVLAYRRAQSVLEKALMQPILWTCTLLLLVCVMAQENLSEWPVWSSI